MKSKKNGKLRLEEETTLLANERTLLSYIRTTFSAFILGFALIQFSRDSHSMLMVGVATIIGGFILSLIGVVEYKLHKSKIRFEAED